MQRIMTWVAVLVLLFAMLLNIGLFFQNRQLKQQLAAASRAQVQQPTQAADPDTIARLRAELERSEQDRIKAVREATSLRDQTRNLQTAAQERDKYKQQVEALQQQNQALQLQVDNLQGMNAINGQMVVLRGLSPTQSVPRQFMDRNQLRAYYTEMLEQEFTAEDERRHRALLRALDINDGGSNLRQNEIDSAVKSILGFYRHDTKQLVVVTNRARMGVGDRITYAHEFVHSLQDQHFDLEKLFERAQGNSDYEQAIRSLVEGDATFSMSLYAQNHLSELDWINYKLEMAQSLDLSGILSFGSGGGPLTESAAMFPYNEGALFVATLYQMGGWEAVRQAFANPPRSTEQIIFPEAYLTGDEPQQITLANLAPRMGNNWEMLIDDTLGQLNLQIYLEGQLAIGYAQEIGSGWGGDRYQVLMDEQGRIAFALLTAWDRQSDADEFFSGYEAYVTWRGQGNVSVLQSSERTKRWQLADRQFYLSQVGDRVLVLHAPDGPTLDTMIAQFPGF